MKQIEEMSRIDGTRILIADNDPSSLGQLERLLSLEGYQLRLLPDGELILQAAHEFVPDAILLKPGEGYAVRRRLKSDGLTRNIPVIYYGVPESCGEVTADFVAGSVDYIFGPFPEKELLTRLALNINLYRSYLALAEAVRASGQQEKALTRGVAV